MKRSLRKLSASLLIAFSPLAIADTVSGTLDTQVRVLDNTGASRGQAQVAGRIASSFTNLAGSDANALALVNALRTGTAATLKYPSTTTTGTATSTGTTTTSTTITPATKPMGWGNVKIALALAQSQLSQLGITKPTADQLQAALNGGSIKTADGTSVTLKGVLTMRADGMGWGQIAQAQGTKLGPVVSSLRTTQSKVAALPVKEHGATTTTAAGTTTASTKGAKSSSVTTAAGTSTAGVSHGSKGITTASGVAPASSSHGIVTAEGGTTASHGHGVKAASSGRGIVTAAGGNVSTAAATMSGKPSGAGIVTGTGTTTASGVTTAHGNAGGNGNAGEHGKGKGG